MPWAPGGIAGGGAGPIPHKGLSRRLKPWRLFVQLPIGPGDWTFLGVLVVIFVLTVILAVIFW
jgi:hypothetical protein